MLKLKKPDKVASAGKRNGIHAGNPQGITASGSALRKIAVIALLVMVIPVALGFTYLILLREPAMQEQQIQRIAASFAVQQSTNMHHFLDRLKSRIEAAARSPLALSAIASRSDEDIALVEQTVLDYFPEVISLRIVPIGEMGTANFEGGNQGLRNHIEVDLVRRTSIGEPTLPEAYKFEKGWLTTITALVTHPRIEDRRAVIIATVDNQLLSEQLMSLDTEAGKFALEQQHSRPGLKRKDVIATAGSGDATDFTSYAEIPDSSWRVVFTPSNALVDTLAIRPQALAVVLVLVILSAICALAIIMILFPRVLDAEVNKVIAAADKKSPLALEIPQLVAIAKLLRRATLRSMRNPIRDPGEATRDEFDTAALVSTDLTNPMFQSSSILDSEEVLELDLDPAATGDEPAYHPPSPEGFPEHIFRAYDIRGNAETELSDELVLNIGRAVATIAGEMGEQTLVVGCDGRTSSPDIKSALIRALMECGRDVIDIGMVPTPLLYFATRHLNCRSGVMVTGSHNPAQDNGFKIVLNQQTIAAGGIQKVRDAAIEQAFSKGKGKMIREDIVPSYLEEVLHDIALAMPLKIVIDAGNGATSNIAPGLFEDLGCEVIPLHCDVDGRFPNRPPDTSNEDNLQELIRVVQREEADLGVAFDGDGDRLAVVTASGHIVRSDVLLMIYAQDVLSRNPGADVVYDIKCSRHLNELITHNGGRPVLWKTGHAFMKEKMAETGALLGGEFSGHMFFGERWYGFDDGMYAAGRLAEILSTLGESLDDSIAGFPKTVNTPEIFIPVAEEKKFALMRKILSNADFSSGKINNLDGLRVDFDDGWGLVRASNTSAALTARFEAGTEETLELIKEEFRTQINLADPKLDLSF